MPLVTYPLEILPTTLAPGHQGRNYKDEAIAVGGQPRYRYRIQEGSLPQGLHLGRKTGEIAGHIRGSGSYTVTIEATDSTRPASQTATQTFTLDVAARS
jgi:hypothetical protein